MQIPEDFKNRVQYMENYIDVLRCSNCSIITTFLTIYGKSQRSELIEKSGIPEKSFHRAINKLIDSNIVNKILDTEKKNRRKIYYQLKEYFIQDPEFDEKFVKFLIKEKNLNLISEWYKYTNQGSIGFISAVTKIIENNIQNNIKKNQPVSLPLKNSLFVELTFPCDNVKPLRDKLESLIKSEIGPLLKNIDPTFKNPIKNATSFYLSLVSLSSE